MSAGSAFYFVIPKHCSLLWIDSREGILESYIPATKFRPCSSNHPEIAISCHLVI